MLRVKKRAYQQYYKVVLPWREQNGKDMEYKIMNKIKEKERMQKKKVKNVKEQKKNSDEVCIENEKAEWGIPSKIGVLDF